MSSFKATVLSCLLSLFFACSDADTETTAPIEQDAILAQFNGRIDLENIPNYSDQTIPNYISKDNTGNNPITNKGAVLGRILFYDINLSADNTIACASCHQQSMAFSDAALASMGVNGTTGRHSMRLINARFADEDRFFWDERASSLEDQTSQPIQDHIEMGFSGTEGDDDILDLFTKLKSIDYYNELFTFVYGSSEITEEKVQDALSQFIRSIQSFDSKFDVGRSQVNNDNEPFPNYTAQENEGKTLFLQRSEFNNNGVRIDGGLGCGGCHRAPEFDIDPQSRNNGIIGSIGGGLDTEVTRSPTLRDLFNASGEINGPMMHTGFSSDFNNVLNHYNNIQAAGNGLDNRLSPGGNPQSLAMTQTERDAVFAFIKTLSGSNVYVDPKWSDPFE